MTLVAGTIARLLTITTVTDRVSQKIGQSIAPQAWTPPFLVLTSVSKVPEHSMTGPSGYAEVILQVDSYGPEGPGGMDGTLKLAAQVRGALDGYAGTLPNGVEVNGIELQNELIEYDQERQQHRVVQEFLVMHNE